MPTIEKLSIALPIEMAALVRRAVDGGEYSSNSEVIHEALRDRTHKRNLREQSLSNLRKAWLEAAADKSEGLDPSHTPRAPSGIGTAFSAGSLQRKNRGCGPGRQPRKGVS